MLVFARMFFKSHITGVLIIVAILASTSGCKIIENLHPELVMRVEEFPGSKSCGDCHIDIYEEWAESAHSKSYLSKTFKVATNDYEYKFCLGCHVPETVFISNMADSGTEGQGDSEIQPRSYNLPDGVDCHGCHLTEDCKLSGPHTGISPHPVEKNEEWYKRSELCGRCHVDTFKEYVTYKKDSSEETCQDCHMPAVNRKLIQNEPWQKLHVRKEGKAHTFSSLSAIEKNRDFVELRFTEINNNSNKITGNAEIVNTKVNHSLPTGKYGYKELLLVIDLKDNLGRIINSRQESMFLELNTQLKPGEKRVYSFAFDRKDDNNDPAKLEALIYRTNFNRTEKTLLAETVLELKQPLNN